MFRRDEIVNIFRKALSEETLRKAVFSKSCDKSRVKSTVTLFKSKDGLKIQIETFTKDNKAYHKNVSCDSAPELLADMALSEYMQTNILTTSGECEIKRSASGNVHIGNRIKDGGGAVILEDHNRKKAYILDKYTTEPFLFQLGICDKNGRIHDKMQAKYRQINRFLEVVGTVRAALPDSGSITVYDLCCGKSYLSFALYFYLEKVLGLSVNMLGADLKRDVIDYCQKTAERSGMSGLKFVCGDIGTLGLENDPDLVVSLHACDIATDIVLAHAIKTHAKVILSTPCCHHELYSKLSEMSHELTDRLGFVFSHSMTSQRLCETLTDSLRAQTLAAYGYKTDILELVSPDDTPKNLLIRAVKSQNSNLEAQTLLEQARNAVGARLTLEKLLSNV